MSEIETVPSRYKIERGDRSFLITGGAERTPVTVRLADSGLAFEVFTEEMAKYPYHNSLVERHNLIKYTAQQIMCNWKSPKGGPVIGRKISKIKDWAIKNTGTALAKRIAAELAILLSKANQKGLAIQKAVFAAAGRIPSDIFLDGWLDQQDEYYLKDILQYRAAALTTWPELKDYNFNANWERLIQPIKGGDWKRAYSPTTESYTTLNKTLMNFPGGIPIHLAARLKNTWLIRPITSRRELIFLLCVTTHKDISDPEDPFTRMIQNTTAEEITRAARRLGEHLQHPINLRKSMDIDGLATYMCDMPTERHNGNICGYLDKAIAWHRRNFIENQARPVINTTLTDFGPEFPTQKPPIELPKNPKIRFLSTVGEMCHESETMQHCVSSYCPIAIRGGSFYFHVEHDGEMATVEVDSNGKVRQVKGPRNKENKACAYATRVLGNWARGLKSKREVNPYNNQSGILGDIPF